MDRLIDAMTHANGRDGGPQPECAHALRELDEASEDRIEFLLDALLDVLQQGRRTNEPLLAAICERLWLRYRTPPGHDDEPPRHELSSPRIGQLMELYRRLGPSSQVRHLLLRVLSGNAGELALEAWLDTMLTDPPPNAGQCDLVFVPLFLLRRFPVDVLFPRLLTAMENRDLAVQVLDLANHVTRRRLANPHPAQPRTQQLLELFVGLVNNLQNLEQRPEQFAAAPRELGQMVGGCVALLVALCDALALIGDPRATAKLQQALDLSHRRVRTEAAAALARLGDETGVDTLAELAAEPSVRRRAIAYLEEIGKEDRVEEELRGDVALAEGDLASWLAEPGQMGLPPQEMELLDHRRQPWPGDDEPVDCYLFDYAYRFPGGELRGVGITGPVVHVFSGDLSHLPPEDIYAIYAGWHAEHEEIRETDAGEFSTEQTQQADAARRELAEIGYGDVEVVKLGRFLDETVAVATARVAGQTGVVVTAGDAMQWFPYEDADSPLNPTETYYLFKGRQLLAGFLPATEPASDDLD